LSIQLRNGGQGSGVRQFPEPITLNDLRKRIWQLAAEVLGRGAIEEVIVCEVTSTVPAVAAIILGEKGANKPTEASDGNIFISSSCNVRRRGDDWLEIQKTIKSDFQSSLISPAMPLSTHIVGEGLSENKKGKKEESSLLSWEVTPSGLAAAPYGRLR
jgi:hypothetical protein